MEQLSALNNQVSAYPNPMKAMERSARDPNVVSGDFNLDFEDVLQVVNPLNYIPGVSTLYQASEGSGKLSPLISLVSGAVLGGPVGLALSAISTGIEMATGATPVGHVLSMFTENTATPLRAASAYENARKL